MIEETRRPNPKSRGERTRRRLRILTGVKDVKSPLISPLSISPTKHNLHLENQRNNNVTKSEPKRKGSLTRLFSFNKKKRPEDGGKFSGSQDTLSETYEVDSPVRKVGFDEARGDIVGDRDLTPEVRLPQDDSTDSFKSAESPVLCNESRERAVEATRHPQPDSNQCLTKTAFRVFDQSDIVQELTEAKPKKKFVWRRLLSKEKVYGTDEMSQNTGAVRKERVRGRGSTPLRKPETLDATPEPPKVTPETPKVTAEPPKATPESPKVTPESPSEETLKISAAVGSQILQQKKEEKVSGDDLRRQLSEGLKNGSGKQKTTKAQLSEITQVAVKTGPEETESYLARERKKVDDEVDGPPLSAPAKRDDSGQGESKPSTSGASGDAAEKTEGPPTEGKKEHLYKILVIGELGTGKTSIIKRYVHQFFSQHYRATIGVDFALKVLNWDDNSIVRLQLWDIAGQERFGNMTRVYYKEAVGAFIVFDVTRAATFEAVNKWKTDLDSKVQLSDGSPIPCVLLANKCDQPKEGLVNTTSKMNEYCKENGFAGWFETSAKENINIEEAAKALVVKILQNDKLIRTGERGGQDTDRIALDGSTEATSGSTCSC